MIIKGGQAGNVGWWTQHLQRDDTNDRAELKEVSGLLATDLKTALREMQAVAAGSRSHGNFMYQANLNPEAHERLTPEQWKEAIDILEKHLGFEGLQRVVVEHEKHGREHRHVIWNRVDVDTMTVRDIGGNYRKHGEASREIEERFGLTPTPSPNRAAKPDRAPELWEIRAAERSGIDREQVKQDVTEAWRTTDSGKAFAAAIEERGYILARGDRRDFCIIDAAGDAHSLARRIEGAKAADVRERMADIDATSLPNVAEAREVMRDAHRADRADEQARAHPPTKMEAKILRLQELAQHGGGSLATDLYNEGIALARVDTAGKAGVQRDYERQFYDARIAGKEDAKLRQATFTEGELVAVTRYGDVHRLNPHRIDLQRLEQGVCGDHPAQSLSAAREFFKEDRTAEQQQNRAAKDARTGERIERRQTAEGKAHDAWSMNRDAETARVTNAASPPQERSPLRVVDTATGVVASLGSFVDSLLGSRPPEPSDNLARIRAQRRALAAVKNFRDSMERGENLRASDVAALTPSHLMNIKANPDAAIRQMIEDMERRSERDRDYGRTRER